MFDVFIEVNILNLAATEIKMAENGKSHVRKKLEKGTAPSLQGLRRVKKFGGLYGEIRIPKEWFDILY